MKYHTCTTEFNCGIDLPARQIYVCLMGIAALEVIPEPEPEPPIEGTGLCPTRISEIG